MKSLRLIRKPLAFPFLLFLLAAPAGAYAPITDANGVELEPNPVLRGNVTIGTHKPACGSDVLCFADDANVQRNLAEWGYAVQNARTTEPIQFTPSKVDCQYYGEDANAKTSVSAWCTNISDNKAWLDTTAWTATGQEGNDTFERSIRNGAHALRIKNAIPASSTDSDTYTLDFTDLTTDVAKLRLIIGVEVVSIGLNGAHTSVSVYDTNLTGYRSFTYRQEAAQKADGISGSALANSTGATFWDELISDGAAGSGGVANGAGKLDIALTSDVTVGATEIYVYALQIDAKRYAFGVDDAGQTVFNMTYADCSGSARSTPLGYVCLSSFAPSFGYQTVKDLKVAYVVKASTLPSDRALVTPSEIKDDATYKWRTNYRFSFLLPQMIDLSFAGDERVQYTLPVSGKQHTTAKLAGVDKLPLMTGKLAQHEVELGTPIVGKDQEVELTVLYTEAQMLAITEVGLLGLPANNPASVVWKWLAGLFGIGALFAMALRRRRKA